MKFEVRRLPVSEVTARNVQDILHQDFARIMSPSDALTIADPTDERSVRQQLDRLTHPAMGTTYLGAFTARETLIGVAKVAQWLIGDQQPFGNVEQTQVHSQQHDIRGLDAFATTNGVDEEETAAFLDEVRRQGMPKYAELRAAVDREDVRLRNILTERQCFKIGSGHIALGSTRRLYDLHVLPATSAKSLD